MKCQVRLKRYLDKLSISDIQNYFLSFFAGLGEPATDINKIREEIDEDKTNRTKSNNL